MRVVIFGKGGQVGTELARAAWPRGFSCVFVGRSNCDLQKTDELLQVLRKESADIVINAAAYTAVDRAESEPAIAGLVNRDAPAAMAKVCAETGAPLIHLSTDYVFDGQKTDPYVESDPVCPWSVYGRSKAEGESAIRDVTPNHVILRTSWVFASHGANFVRTILRLGRERSELRIVDDQRGSPTAARDIASAVIAIAARIAEGCTRWGTLHFTSGEPTTWYGFAEAIVQDSGLPVRLVPISTAQYPTPARRPANSILNCACITREYEIAQPSWRHALHKVLAELGALDAERGSIAR